MKNKILAIVLSVLMLIGLLPVSALAAPVASDAVAIGNSGCTLKLTVGDPNASKIVEASVQLHIPKDVYPTGYTFAIQYDPDLVTPKMDAEGAHSQKIGPTTTYYGVKLDEYLPPINLQTSLKEESGKSLFVATDANAAGFCGSDADAIDAVLTFFFELTDKAINDGGEAEFKLATGKGSDTAVLFALTVYGNDVPFTALDSAVTATQTFAGISVTNLEVTTAPTKTAYTYGEAFDSTGMVVKATYDDGSVKENFTDYTIAPAKLTAATTKVTISAATGTPAEQAITVAPKALTVTGLTATNREYDGTTDVALSGGALDGVLSGDTVNATMPTAGTIADANAGTGKAVTFTAIALTGADAANYTVTQPTVTVDITKATLTAADFDLPTVEAVEYNGLQQSVAAPTLKSGKTGAGAVTVKYAGSTTAPTNYGTYAITFDVAEGTNYDAATGLEIGTLHISKTLAKVTTAPTANTLTYDGTERALITAGAADTAMEYSRAEDGTYTATIPAETAAGTYEVWYRAAADNDHDASTATKLTVTIAKATPTVTAPTGKTDLAYSGSNQALIEAGSTTGGTLQYSIDGTTYSATVPSAKDAKTYTVSYKVVGNANYNDVAAATVTATIAKKPITVTGITAANKDYDGTATATLDTTGAQFDGIVSGDTLALAGTVTGAFADANAGENKNVTISGLALAGDDAANYTLTATTASATATINKLAVTITPNADQRKEIDAEDPVLTYTASPALIGSDAFTGKLGRATGESVGNYAITLGDLSAGDNYTLALSGTVNFEITKIQAQVTTAPTAKTGLTYDGTEQALVNAGEANHGDIEYSKDNKETWSTTVPTAKDAGTNSVWYRAKGNSDYDPSTPVEIAGIAIAKKTVTVTGITAENKVYDGETTATLVTSSVAFDGIVSGDTLALAGTVTGAFADANAGENKTVTITGIELGGASKDNYQLSATTATATATIAKKTITPTVTIAGWTYGETAKTPELEGNTGNGAVTYQYKVTNEGDDTYTATVPTDANSYTLKATIAATTNTSEGTATATFTIARATNPAVIPLDTVKVRVGGTRDLKALITDNRGGAITLDANGMPTGTTLTDGVLTAGTATGTFTVNVTITENDNYLAKTGSFSVEITEKEPQELSYAETAVEKTYGDAAFTNPLTQTKVEGAITYTSSSETVATVDETGKVTILTSGETTITATAAATAEYAEQTASYVLKVEKKQVTVKAIDRTIYVNGTVPDLSAPAKNTDYQVLGLIGDDELDLTTPITMAYKKDGAAADPDNTKTGTYAIIIEGGAVPDANKYKAEIEYVDATLSITYPPAPEPTQTETTETGSVTTSAEVKDGEAKATVDEQTVTDALKDAEDAEILTVKVDTENADSVEATLPADAVKAAAEADVDLHVETENGTIKLDNDVLKDAAESGKEVAVTVKQNSNGTTTFDVTAGGESVETSVKVELPATKSNEVLKIVKEDGTEEVVKKSISEDGVVYAEIPAGATVRVEEVESEFTDVKDDDWFAEEVGFVADRGIFNGMTETEFEPETNMSRAMLATVLYRLEDAEATGANPFADVADDQWFTDGVVWAADAGIVNGTGDGFDPNENASREQIAAMLHRYVQYLGIDLPGSADLNAYTDGDQVSDWAKDDMAWAVSVGLFQGNGDGTLNPTGDATRAEVAALIQRLVALIVK